MRGKINRVDVLGFFLQLEYINKVELLKTQMD
jgi:hypothetical protein